MTHEVVEEIAKAASVLYGQVWAALPQWSKDIWRETVRHDDGQIYSDASRCAAEAKKAHLEKREEVVAPHPTEKKPKKVR